MLLQNCRIIYLAYEQLLSFFDTVCWSLQQFWKAPVAKNMSQSLKSWQCSCFSACWQMRPQTRLAGHLVHLWGCSACTEVGLQCLACFQCSAFVHPCCHCSQCFVLTNTSHVLLLAGSCSKFLKKCCKLCQRVKLQDKVYWNEWLGYRDKQWLIDIYRYLQKADGKEFIK